MRQRTVQLLELALIGPGRVAAGSGTGARISTGSSTARADAINFALQLPAPSPGKQRRLCKHAVAMTTWQRR